MSADLMRYLDSGAWANPNPLTCECRGRGWLLSDHDTWHKCPYHGKDAPHPEWECDGFDFAAHREKVFTDAYDYFCREAARLDIKDFDATCRAGNPDLPDLVNKADEIITGVYNDLEDRRAKAAGYSCALEARFAEEAAYEGGY